MRYAFVIGLVGNAKIYHYKTKRKVPVRHNLHIDSMRNQHLFGVQEFVDVVAYQQRRRKQQQANSNQEAKSEQGTLYHIQMYWVACSEEDIITIVSDGLHHNLGMYSRPSKSYI